MGTGEVAFWSRVPAAPTVDRILVPSTHSCPLWALHVQLLNIYSWYSVHHQLRVHWFISTKQHRAQQCAPCHPCPPHCLEAGFTLCCGCESACGPSSPVLTCLHFYSTNPLFLQRKTWEGTHIAPSQWEEIRTWVWCHPYNTAFPLNCRPCSPGFLTVFDSAWKRK